MRYSFIILVCILLLITVFSGRLYAQDCYLVAENNIASIDLNGDDMWLHITKGLRPVLLTTDCIVVGEQFFVVSTVQESGEIFLKLKHPPILQFKMLVAGLAQ